MIKLFILAVIILYLMYRIESERNLDLIKWAVVAFIAFWAVTVSEMLKEMNLC